MNVALFPLNAVLFPDGVLPLRVFEARYMDMVRDCLRHDTPFGVCRIVKGAEVRKTAEPEAVGCLAAIRAWDMQQLGVLHVRAVGTVRFRVLDARVQADGLLRAEVETIDADPDGPVAPVHRPCVDLLSRIIDDLRQQRAAREPDAEAPLLDGLPFEAPFRLDSQVWVGNRLCEVLPIPLKARQKLMELEDGHARLDLVLQFLRQHAIVR